MEIDSDDLDKKLGLRNFPQDFSELVMVAELAEVVVAIVELFNQEVLCSGHGHEIHVPQAGGHYRVARLQLIRGVFAEN